MSLFGFVFISDVIISTLGEGTFGKVVEVLDEETYVKGSILAIISMFLVYEAAHLTLTG